MDRRYYPVLDHGFVALVDIMGDESSITEAARVSYQQGTSVVRDDVALLRYLYRHWHTTPFEMVELKFHCAMPIFVARQWVRHRTASLNEMSGRYSEMPNAFHTPTVWRTQSKTNKQGSDAVHPEGAAMEALSRADGQDSFDFYKSLLAAGVAREQARIGLPVSSYTQWYWKTDLHNLLHFLTLRCDSHAQEEIRVYADVIAGIVRERLPNVFQAWLDYRLNAVQLSGPQAEFLNARRYSALIATDAQVCVDTLGKREGMDLHRFMTDPYHVRTAKEFALDRRTALTPEEAYERFYGYPMTGDATDASD